MHASLNIKGPGFLHKKDHEAAVTVQGPKVELGGGLSGGLGGGLGAGAAVGVHEDHEASVRAQGPKLEVGVAAPRVDLEAAAPKAGAGVEVSGPRADFGVAAPKAKVGLEVGGPKVEVDHTKMDVDLDVHKPQVGLEAHGGLDGHDGLGVRGGLGGHGGLGVHEGLDVHGGLGGHEGLDVHGGLGGHEGLDVHGGLGGHDGLDVHGGLGGHDGLGVRGGLGGHDGLDVHGGLGGHDGLDVHGGLGGHGGLGLNVGLGGRAGLDAHAGVDGHAGLRDPVGEEFNNQCVDAHNRVREAHGVPPLRHNPELVASAQHWADELAREDKFEHSSNRPDDIGENIGMKWESNGTIFTGFQATQQWYDEIDQYTFQGEENLACGHFSQVVWKGTTECGFAKAMTKDGKLLVVGHYAPAGNYVGEWAENVLPPRAGVKVQLPDWPTDHPAHATAELHKIDEFGSVDLAFSEEVLHAHNEHRSKHNVEALAIDKDLSVIAQKHAEFLAENHRFEHSRNRFKGGIIGENIACKVISMEPDAHDYSGKELIDVWYSEESQYEYDGQSPKLSAGHFTQIVWKNTKVIGVGKAIDQKESKVIVVINYHPAGNILKRFRENVNERANN